jgi:MFS family permease
VLIGLVVARIAFAFQLQSVAVIAPGLMSDLALDALSIGTLVGLFMLPGLLLAVPGGLLGQWFGERRFLITCLVAMTVGGLICGFARDYQWLWLGRLISGFGTIGINVVMAKVVIDWFQDKEIATAMAVFLAAYPAGIALALVTLGQLATADSWPTAFVATAAFSFAALLVFVATYRAAEGTGDDAEPALKPSPGETAMVSLAGLIWALYNAAYIILVSFVPLYLVSEGMAAGTAASLVGIGLWVAIFAAPLGGVMVDRFGRATPIIVTGVVIWGFGLLLVIPWSHSIPLLIALFAVTALFGNIPPGPIVALASEVLRPATRGAGMGVFYTWLYGGIAHRAWRIPSFAGPWASGSRIARPKVSLTWQPAGS